MKTRFTTIDLMAVLHEIRTNCIGIRVYNIYDIDHKTYLIKLVKSDQKYTILIESGIRMYLTGFDYPKNILPSSFSMKLRKHIKQKRLESVQQLGIDRIVDLCFGSGEVACHVIIELYDRGNIVLTDHQYVILNVLRPRTDKENTDVKFIVRERYPIDAAKHCVGAIDFDSLNSILTTCPTNDNLRKVLTPTSVFGPALLEHCLIKVGLMLNTPISKLDLAVDSQKIFQALVEANQIFCDIKNSDKNCVGTVSMKLDKRPLEDNEMVESYVEFHPVLFEQLRKGVYKTFLSFNAAVDEFFSKIESQRLDLKSIQQEKTVVKKLENVKRDHENRLKSLQEAQTVDERRAELIEMNKGLVEKAIIVVNSALANQMTWVEIQELIDEAKDRGDKVACAVKSLKLETNHITLRLGDPFQNEQFGSSDEDETDKHASCLLVDIDLGLGAFQNARKYYTQKKQSALKEHKTLQASEKALKSAECKTQELLKQVQTNRRINKARKLFWFEKFFWFISSDALLVIGGRDAQQNELIVKRYLKPGDAYVHADVRGAASVVIKNKTDNQSPIPPKTLSEAGSMAVCYSAAWPAKVVVSAWWVNADQVSKTAPTGEYLTTGSFMIRGKKNLLPPCQLIMGFGVMFRLDDESAARRMYNRKLNSIEDADDQQGVIGEDIAIDISEDEQEQPADDVHFPDVALTLKHLNVEQIEEEEYSVIRSGLSSSNKQQQPKTAKNFKNVKSKQVETPQIPEPPQPAGQKNPNQLKRGQKSKLKRIKQKYQDQDEDERVLRLQILGNQPKKNQIVAQVSNEPIDEDKIETVEVEEQELVEQDPTVDIEVEQHDQDDDDETFKLAQEIVNAADSLTGIACESDDSEEVVLFAVSVCAPYNVMTSWKFKVKLTPGTGKKGKATKAALDIFLRDKTLSAREKEFLKALADQDLARNLPGKVKLSAPQLHRVKKK